MKDDRLSVAPVLVVDLYAVLCSDRAHCLISFTVLVGMESKSGICHNAFRCRRGRQSHVAAVPSALARTVRRDGCTCFGSFKSVIGKLLAQVVSKSSSVWALEAL